MARCQRHRNCEDCAFNRFLAEYIADLIDFDQARKMFLDQNSRVQYRGCEKCRSHAIYRCTYCNCKFCIHERYQCGQCSLSYCRLCMSQEPDVYEIQNCRRCKTDICFDCARECENCESGKLCEACGIYTEQGAYVLCVDCMDDD